MKKYNILIKPMDINVEVEKGTTLLDAQIMAGLKPDAPCGGNGTCGKCLVEIITEDGIKVEKACQIEVEEDMVIRAKVKGGEHQLLMQGSEREIVLEPPITRQIVNVDNPTIDNITSEWDRIRLALGDKLDIDEKNVVTELSLFDSIYDNLNENDYVLRCIMFDNEIIDVFEDEGEAYSVAVDIGTTSVVCYLLEAETGKEIAVKSTLNPQSQYGADVIQRLNYAIENGVEALSSSIRRALNELISEAAKQAGINKEKIYLVSIVGNTCMHHLFLGITPKPLGKAPYNPMLDEEVVIKAKEYDIEINKRGKILVLPNIAGFVGADTMGVVLATEFEKLEQLTLAIDIGTNGEMVMGNKDKMISCSTAAGPAFEGAKITCGMRGKEGAIERAKFVDGILKYEVIGNVEAVGICGSGLLDIIAAFVEEGVVDETGRFDLENSSCENCIIEIEGKKAFRISEKVFVTQGDIREVQLAKSAIAAGIGLMAEKIGIEIDDIEKVMIAGAFGNYMSPHSACVLGMIPPQLEEKVVPIGNAAGEGAKIAALNLKEFYKAGRVAEKIEFLELAVNPKFQEYFVDNLGF